MLSDIMTEGECSQLRSLLAQSETIVLCCHQNADGDALGAVLGMGEVLRQMGKEPLMVAPDQYPDYLQWLPNSEKIVRYDKRKDYVDMVLKIADRRRLPRRCLSTTTWIQTWMPLSRCRVLRLRQRASWYSVWCGRWDSSMNWASISPFPSIVA